MIVLIGSPDKISLGMFSDFLTTVVRPFPVADFHYLVSSDFLDSLVEEFLQENQEDALIRYYANKKIKQQSLPQKLINAAEIVVWLPRFSVQVEIVKDKDGFVEGLMPRWKMNIERLSKLEQAKEGLPLM